MEKHLTESELRALLSVLRTALDNALGRTGLDTGARVGEVVGIQTSNIDFEHQIIKLWDEKKDKWREAIVTKSTLQAIEIYLNGREEHDPKLFPFSAKTANRKLKVWCKRAGIPSEKAHWHSLRHTYIVQSRLKGRDLKAVQQQTGDSELTILKIYSTLTPDERRRDAEEHPIIPEI